MTNDKFTRAATSTGPSANYQLTTSEGSK